LLAQYFVLKRRVQPSARGFHAKKLTRLRPIHKHITHTNKHSHKTHTQATLVTESRYHVRYDERHVPCSKRASVIYAHRRVSRPCSVISASMHRDKSACG